MHARLNILHADLVLRSCHYHSLTPVLGGVLHIQPLASKRIVRLKRCDLFTLSVTPELRYPWRVILNPRAPLGALACVVHVDLVLLYLYHLCLTPLVE